MGVEAAMGPPDDGLRGWLLYDGSCGMCARVVPWWSTTLHRIGLGNAPLQAPWVAARMSLRVDELLEDVTILLADGAIIRGAHAYRWILRRCWWGFPLWLVVVIPPGRWAFDLGYRCIARHRHRVSQICHLHPPDPRSLQSTSCHGVPAPTASPSAPGDGPPSDIGG